jgi:hypothetical protein
VNAVQGKKSKSSSTGQALLVVDVKDTIVDPSRYYLADVEGMAKLVAGADVQQPLARVLMVCMPPRQKSLVPDSLDV